MRRPTGRPRPLADKPAVALGRRHGRIAIVVRTSATGGKGRKAPTRVVHHEPVFGHRVQMDVYLTRRTRLRVPSDDVAWPPGPLAIRCRSNLDMRRRAVAPSQEKTLSVNRVCTHPAANK